MDICNYLYDYVEFTIFLRQKMSKKKNFQLPAVCNPGI